MAKRKTHLTIKVSRPRKKELKRARQKEAQLIPRSCLKWPGFLDLIASPQISLKKKKQNSPIKLTDRKRTFLSRSPGTPLSKGTPHGRQKFRPTPSKSPAMKRLRGSSARSLFSNETCDDTFEAFPLVFTEQESADVGEFKVSSRSLINVDPLEPVHQMSDTLQSVSISQTPHEQEIQEMNAILPDVLKALEESGTKKSFLDFCRLVHSNNFPLDNIAYLLWVEVLRWYTTENTSSMRYSDQTKKFWKLGLRIFGGKFINFMSGHKNTAQVVLGEASKGEFSPLNSEINFAVPSVDILRSFTPYSEFETRERPPGMLTDAMQSLAGALKSKSACLTYDGKKIKQGLTENSGDVNILGHEDSMSLRQRQEELKSKICVIEKTVKDLEQLESCVDIKTLNQETHTNSVQSLQFALKDLSCSVIDILDIKEKKEYSKKKLIERGGEENWRKGKYVFAISGIIAFIHDIDDFLQGFEKLRETICQYLAYIQGSKYITGNKVNINQCDNYQELGDSAPSTSDTRLVRQRTDEWKTIREKAKITGSTFFKAIGLDGLQKEKEHFEEVICHVPPKPFSEAVQEMLDYGTNNEQNAAATLVGKVLPVIEPNVRFYEEGCVELDESFMVVSPDGSLRQTDSLDSTTAAIEFKCPVYQLHKKLPPRYLLQCLAEMEALNVEKLIYLSWRPDFSSVFLLNKDSDLFERSYEIAKNIYGNENPKKPTKLSNDVKALKEEIATKSSNVELIGLFESAVNDRSVDNTNMSEAESVNAKDLLTVLNDIKTMQIRSYNLRREKASEAIVYLCCDLDRLWTKDSIKCAPVCWFPKGYSLNTETLRRVSQDVHNRCHEAGIHIPAESFDGQWHNLVVRSVMGQPLTVLQLQKDVWREAERTKKSDIIRTFKDLNKVPEYERECGKMICTNKGIILPGFPSVRNHHSTVQTDCIESNDMSTTLLETIPDSILHLNSDGALELQTELLAFTEVDKDIEIDIMSANVNDTEWANVLSNSENPEEESTDTSTTVISGPSVEVEPQNTEPDSDMNVMTGEHKLNVADAITLLALLKADNKCNKKGRWNDVQTGELMDILSSTDKLGKLRDFELRVLARYITRTSGIKVKESSSKASKLDSLSNILGLGKPQIDSRTKRRKATPRRLVELSSSVLSKKVSKHMLNIVYAKYIWQGRYKKWFNDSPLRENPVIDDSAYPSLWFYTPEFSETRQQLEVRCIDSTHLLTRARRKCCKGGLHGLPNTPWLTVAKTKTTFLSPIMIEEITEPMSVSMAVTHFSEPVERKMRQNGDIDAADLCRDIRDWWKSEDDPGIPAKDRIVMRQNLRERLLDEVDFNEFPPPTTNIRGWPLQLWEALLANIDAKSLLYALCETGTYNVRAFSSMMGETFFSELTQYDKQGHGTVTTTEFGRFIGTATEKLYTRMDPNR